MKAGVVLAGSAMKAGVLTTGVVRLMAGVLFADMVQ